MMGRAAGLVSALLRRRWAPLPVGLLLAVAIACGAEAAPTSPAADTRGPEPSSGAAPAAAPGVADEAIEVPMVDKSIHSVPLDDIVFDTFDSEVGHVTLDLAPRPLVEELRDAIIPILRPAYGPPDALPWLKDDSLVIGYVAGDGAYAYPVNVLDRHEIVNDEISGMSVLVTYCPLCFSGVVLSRELDGRVLTFGNTSALYQSDLVMYDYQTGSYWFQVAGKAVVGPLTGSRLNLLPSTTMAWGDWRRLYPQTRLLTGTDDNPTLFAGNHYGRGFPAGYQERVNSGGFVFPVDKNALDGRLPFGEVVLTIEVDDSVAAFPLGAIGDGAVNHQVGGRPIVVLALAGHRAVGAFSPVVHGRTLTFDYRDDVQSFVDRETGSLWDAAGRATGGPLAGSQIQRLNTRRALWFSVAIAFPEAEVYLP